MYTKFYGFKCKPFDLLPDPRFLYLSQKHDLALSHLEYGITDNKGFIVLTGDVGAGKTTLINFFLKKIKAGVNTALIFNTNIDPTTFLEMVVRDFGLQPSDTRRSALYDSLYQFLLNEHVQGRHSVLIIDEAQNMPKETLEEVRMLSNFETEESYLLQIIMAGQPQLRRRLNDPELAQLTQRVSVYYHLSPLEKSEVGGYIEHRLKVSGYNSSHPLFSSDAIEKIYAYSSGVPRLVSSICDTALLYGYSDEIRAIDSDLIERVIKDRGIDPGIRHEEERVTGKAVDSRDSMYPKVLKFAERLARIEQRLDILEKTNDQQGTISKLAENLNEAHKKNLKLHEKYQALLLKYNMVHSSKQKTPPKTKSKIPEPKKN